MTRLHGADHDSSSYVAALAAEWAQSDQLQRWIHDAPDAPRPLTAENVPAETIDDYLAEHNPFPDESAVDVLTPEGEWVPAEIEERTANNEWSVYYPDTDAADGEWAGFRGINELRPRTGQPGPPVD